MPFIAGNTAHIVIFWQTQNRTHFLLIHMVESNCYVAWQVKFWTKDSTKYILMLILITSMQHCCKHTSVFLLAAVLISHNSYCWCQIAKRITYKHYCGQLETGLVTLVVICQTMEINVLFERVQPLWEDLSSNKTSCTFISLPSSSNDTNTYNVPFAVRNVYVPFSAIKRRVQYLKDQ